MTFKHGFTYSVLATAVVFSGTACSGDDIPEPLQLRATRGEAASAADLLPTVNEFRTLLGDPSNTTPGQTTGRREVNWDAVPGTQTNTNTFPGDFFAQTDSALPDGRKRGILFSVPGSGMRISDNDFLDVESTYPSQISSFSPARTFQPVGSTQVDCTFRVAGTNEAARVEGFGVVFCDVDRDNSASIELFQGETSLGRVFARRSTTNARGFSFVGARAIEGRVVTRVRITSGSAPIAAGTLDVTNGGSADIVVMDDFLFSEPRP